MNHSSHNFVDILNLFIASFRKSRASIFLHQTCSKSTCLMQKNLKNVYMKLNKFEFKKKKHH